MKINGQKHKKRNSSSNNLDVECFKSERKRDKKMSYEEIVYELITEIPHYFDDKKLIDDSKIIDLKSKNNKKELEKDKHSKSVDKRKIIKDNMKRKSIMYDENKSYVSVKFDSKEKDEYSKYEEIIETEEAFFKLDDNHQLPGVATVSDFRFKFTFLENKNYEKVIYNKNYFSIPYFCIYKIEKTVDKKQIGKYNIEITTKDNRQLKLIIVNDDFKLFLIIQKFACPENPRNYSFFAKKFCDIYKYKIQIDGWRVYNLETEFLRQKVDFLHKVKLLFLC